MGGRHGRREAGLDDHGARLGDHAGGVALSTAPVEVPTGGRRRYDSSRRQEKAARTRQAILNAGIEVLQGYPIRDWAPLTIRSVAERAGVNERTVYRHFTNERGLHDAVMHEREQRSGIALDGMELSDVAAVTRRILGQVARFPMGPVPDLDPTLADARSRTQQAILEAVAASGKGWSAREQKMVAALLDLTWSVGAFERLVRDWGLNPDDAIDSFAWLVGLIEAAVERGSPPS